MNTFFPACIFGMLVASLSLAAYGEGDANAGKALFPVCMACHGPQGLGNQAMNAPKLAGQEDWYIIKQMQLFQNDARGTAPGDMHGMQMAAMAKGPQLQSEEALANLAAYIGTLPNTTPTATVSGDAAAGKKLYPICAACHGPRGEGSEAMSGPKLVGQNDWYLVGQIKKFKQGQRGYHKLDHGGRQMRPMVAMLTDDKSINDIVAYINTLN
ncbi:MAG: c-type cytochrome [Pseudomonadales bacterium]|jgi:cytochrome c oxidase subunit II|nr:c-type cytochrome [Pseudomonadales bacterium]